MAKILVTTGRGGSGKTTFVALAAKYLSSSERPSLIIDLDGDQSLADMLGVDLKERNVKTILDILFDLQKGKAYEELKSMPMPQKIEYLFHSDCVYESEKFDLVTLGVKWTSGCYCLPNDLLRGIIPGMARSYERMLVDTPGGLEHLNRKVVSEIDDLFFVLDPSLKAIKNVQRTLTLAGEIGIRYKNCYLVSNHSFKQDSEDLIRHEDGTSYLGKVEYDPNVENYNLIGKSLLELPDDSPACRSIARILTKAGYKTGC
ncbi:MAG: AAA family ATPase [Dehalococcoidia bacterium]|nr:AAA family ATPase [Dehalococcoidia bacterium]